MRRKREKGKVKKEKEGGGEKKGEERKRGGKRRKREFSLAGVGAGKKQIRPRTMERSGIRRGEGG